MKYSKNDIFRINSKVNISPSHILYLESNCNYTFIHTTDCQHLHTKTLKIVAERLFGIKFIKVRRGLMVNSAFIRHINYNKLNPYVELNTGEKFQISRRLFSEISENKYNFKL